jgi:GDP/UDP-N,N'-diacetylbacillosamine 2-epimerase (hydrolysing)
MESVEMKRKILYITGTRADYGLMRSVLFEIEKNPDVDLELAVTGMHLMDEFGMTINDIEKDGFKFHRINVTFEEDSKLSMVKFIGEFIKLLSQLVLTINPDIILLLGDRGEMLGGAIVGAYLSIPTAHLHGGEITSTVDEYARHAITKLVNIHFPSTEKSAERIIKMGESPENVFIVGAPGLDYPLNEKLVEPKIISARYNLNLSEPIILLVQHPTTLESKNSTLQARETLDALTELKKQTIIIYPNADAGGRKIIEIIKEYEHHPFIHTYKSIPSIDYLSLMKIASVIVGNSSSGIIEAPSFKLPAVNIGSRQEGRERASNVIDVNHDKEEIKKAITKAIYDKEFEKTLQNCENPYSDGKTGKIVSDILSNIKLDNKLMNKKLNL